MSAEHAIRVSGAGNPSSNGVYQPSETHSGKPQWRSGNGCEIYWNGHDAWRIGPGYGYQNYVCSSSSLPPMSGWRVNCGTSPAPTLQWVSPEQIAAEKKAAEEKSRIEKQRKEAIKKKEEEQSKENARRVKLEEENSKKRKAEAISKAMRSKPAAKSLPVMTQHVAILESFDSLNVTVSMDKYNSNRSSMIKSLESASKDIQKIDQNVTLCSATRDAKISDLKKEIDSTDLSEFTKIKESSDSEISTAQATVAKNKELVRTYQQQIKDLQQKIVDVENDTAAAEEKIKVTQASISQARKKYDRDKEKTTALQTEMDILINVKDEEQSMREKIETLRDSLRLKMDSTAEMLKALFEKWEYSWQYWQTNDVTTWLTKVEDEKFAKYSQKFQNIANIGITGNRLPQVNDAFLQLLGISDRNDRETIALHIRRLVKLTSDDADNDAADSELSFASDVSNTTVSG